MRTPNGRYINPPISSHQMVKASLSKMREGSLVTPRGLEREFGSAQLSAVSAERACDDLVKEGYAVKEGDCYRPAVYNLPAFRDEDEPNDDDCWQLLLGYWAD